VKFAYKKTFAQPTEKQCDGSSCISHCFSLTIAMFQINYRDGFYPSKNAL